jgi:anaerobic selenocysteine-containing dehydrogenase
VGWREALSVLSDRLQAAARGGPDGLRFLISAHAAHEEIFLFQRLVEELVGARPAEGGTGPAPLTVSWRVSPKRQPPTTAFRVPAVDAPNGRGAAAVGLLPAWPPGAEAPEPDVRALQTAVASGRVAALYVYDPGPAGSIGDTSWVVEARTSGALPLLVVQGVLLTPLAQAADVVLPGATWLEKQASYTNDQGRLQGTARAFGPPGDARDDWQILVDLGAALGVSLPYLGAAEVRAALDARWRGMKELETITAFERPVAARHWLQASNPSERWKWDVLFQDLPPVKGAVDSTALPMEPGMIRLREVKVESHE